MAGHRSRNSARARSPEGKHRVEGARPWVTHGATGRLLQELPKHKHCVISLPIRKKPPQFVKSTPTSLKEKSLGELETEGHFLDLVQGGRQKPPTACLPLHGDA